MPLIPQDSERSVGLGGHFGPSTSLSAASSMPLFQQRDSEAAAQPPAQTAVPTPPQQGAVESSSSSSARGRRIRWAARFRLSVLSRRPY